MRIAIIGQQDFGKATLEAFLARGDTVAAVFCAPEKGRPDPLRVAGEERGVPVHQFPKLTDPAALEAMRARDDDRRALRDRLEEGLGEDMAVVSAGAERLPGHSLISVPGLRADLVVLALDEAGYVVSAGSACSAGDAEPSHVLVAQGMDTDEARCVIRVTIGIDTSVAEVDGFLLALNAAVMRLRTGALS